MSNPEIMVIHSEKLPDATFNSSEATFCQSPADPEEPGRVVELHADASSVFKMPQPSCRLVPRGSLTVVSVR